jgi:hypothetical protein
MRPLPIRRPRSAKAIALLGAGVVALAVVPVVLAVPASARPTPQAPAALADPASAARAAAQFHTRVGVADATSETTQLVANADGSFTVEENAVPVRAKDHDGAWAPIDLTLHANADGSVSPAVTAVPLALSGGGAAPLATLTQAATGQRYTLGWPGTLPRPALAGDTATYAEVLPGVDLQVRAERDGFAEVLVVKTRAAARNPAVRRLRFTTSTTDAGLKAAAFRVGASAMWDSTVPATPDPGTGDPAASDAHGPGRAARQAPMTVQPAGGDLTVVPDPTLLDAPDAQLPFYIDPQVSAGRWHWTMINGYHIDQSYWSFDRAEHGKVGFVVDNGNQLYRSIWDFDTSAWRGKHVLSAIFSADLLHSLSCSNSNTELHLTGAVDPGTTWRNNVNTWGPDLANVSNQSCHDARTYSEWAGGGVNNVAVQSTGWATITLGLRASTENNNVGWKKFDENSPKFSVTYNSYPNVPDTVTVDNKACVTGAARPWISTIGQHSPVLKARLTDPDASNTMGANFTYTDKSGTGRSVNAGNIANGGYAQVTAPFDQFASGGTYAFRVDNTDGIDRSAPAGPCEFSVDTTAPDKAPNVTSADGRYPSDDGSAGWHVGVGVPGTFTLDPNGVNDDGVDDVASYLYGALDPPSTPVVAPSLGAPVTVTVTPTKPGINTLFVRSVDRAGNLSAITRYRFFVAGGTPPVDAWGMGEGGGTVAYDSARTNNLTLSAGTGWVAGRTQDSNAAHFDGTTGGADAAGPLLDTSQSYTVAAWVRLTDTNDYRTVISQQGTTSSAFVLQYRPGSNRWAWLAGPDVANTAWTSAFSAAPPTVGEWTHLTGVYDAAAHQLRLYVNGTLDATTAWTGAWNATGPLHVGKVWFNASLISPFAGDISDVRVWQRAITGDEALALASDGTVSRLGLGSATADSACAVNEDAANALDGLTTTKWCSAGTRWMQTAVTGQHTVTDIVVRHAGAGGEPSTWDTRDYDVQASADGNTWTTVLQVRGNTADVTHSRLPAPVRAAFLKLVVITPAQDGNFATRIYEFEAYGVDGTFTNAALHQPATGSAACVPTETPDKAVDGVMGTNAKWCSSVADKWLQVDLGFDRSIGWLTVRGAGAGGEQAAWDVRDYDISVSSDGTTWTPVQRVRGNAVDVSGGYLSSPYVGRYVRLNVITATQNGDPAARIDELEVYAQ